MDRIRVLVVDDSFVVRRVVTEELMAQPDIEVAGSAATGRIALEKAAQLDPDLVILDIEMPEMDGLTALSHLRRSHPRTKVIMFSSLTELGAAATLEALSRGASDFFPKPSGAGGLEASRQLIRDELIPAIRALGKRRDHPARQAPQRVDKPLSSALPGRPAARIDVVAIGASTGGPNALMELFSGLPADFPAPLLVVQHMPPMFTQMLAERLTKHSKIATVEACSGMELTPGKAWIAPGDFHLEVVREGYRVRTLVHQAPPENACRPAVDPLFRSVARVFGDHCLAVVLTGMGQDGLRGCETIRGKGGQVVVQDEATSIVWGMPGYVARAGFADQVAPLPKLASEIMRRVSKNRG
jgi:two-component system chemotaxis response regulator CheB